MEYRHRPVSAREIAGNDCPWRKRLSAWNSPFDLCGDYLDGLSSEGALRTGEESCRPDRDEIEGAVKEDRSTQT